MINAFLSLPMEGGTSNEAIAIANPSVRTRAMQDVFLTWWCENSYALEDGGCGDVETLFAALCAVSQNA